MKKRGRGDGAGFSTRGEGKLRGISLKGGLHRQKKPVKEIIWRAAVRLAGLGGNREVRGVEKKGRKGLGYRATTKGKGWSLSFSSVGRGKKRNYSFIPSQVGEGNTA